MKNKKQLSSTIAEPDLSDNLQSLGELALGDDSDFESFKIEQADLSFVEAKSCRIENAIFERVTLQSTDLRQTKLTDLRFANCDFSNATWCDDKLSRVQFFTSKLTAFRFIDGEMANVV
ncbi:pentapeptide repeat-containing protein, partial [Cutibacterium acnes]